MSYLHSQSVFSCICLFKAIKEGELPCLFDFVTVDTFYLVEGLKKFTLSYLNLVVRGIDENLFILLTSLSLLVMADMSLKLT